MQRIARARIVVLYIVLTLLCFGGSLLADSEEANELCTEWKKKASDAMDRDLSLAIALADSAELVAQQASLWEQQISVQVWKARISRYWNELQDAKFYLEKAQVLLEDYKQFLSPEQAEFRELDIKIRIGAYYRLIGDLPSAQRTFDPIVEELRAKPQLTDPLYNHLMVAILNQASVAKDLGNIDKAIETLQYVINYEEQRAKEENRPAVYGSSYSRLAELFALKGELRSARKYYLRGAKFYEQLFAESPEKKSKYRAYIIKLYLGLADTYAKLEQHEQAELNFDKAQRCHRPKDPEFAGTYEKIGRYHLQAGNLDKATYYLEQSESHWEMREGSKKFHLRSGTYFALSQLYQQQGDWQKAKQYVQAGIENLLVKSEGQSFDTNPPIDLVHSKSLFLDGLVQKTKLQFEMARAAESSDPAVWKACWKSSQLSFDLLENMRCELSRKSDKQAFIERAYPLLEIALEVAYELGEEYHEAAWSCMERSKALLLMQGLQESTAMSVSGIPADQQETFKDLRLAIFSEEQKLLKANEEELRQIKISIYEKQNELEEIEKRWRQNFPAFAAASANFEEQEAVHIQQQLKENQTVLEYFVGARHYYIVKIESDQAPQLHRFAIHPQMLSYCRELKRDVQEKRDQQYLYKARFLHDHLIGRAELGELKEELILIPDAELWHVPFDILLSEDMNDLDFANAPYLLRSHIIGYAFSMRWFSELVQRSEQSELSGVLCMAPSFLKDGLTVSTRGAEALQLAPLKYNMQEVKGIGNLIDAAVCTGSSATKAYFTENAGNFAIIHVASHAFVDDQYPEHSFIAFTNQGNSGNENRLFISELHNHPIRAEIVILSACETGAGKALMGEGVISLSRAFARAGARSTMASLWKIDDQSTKNLMSKFYSFLLQKQGRTAALRNAKLAYLKSAEKFEAHPYYWAAFGIYGHTAPVNSISSSRSYLSTNSSLGVSALMSTLLLLVIWYRKKSKAQIEKAA